MLRIALALLAMSACYFRGRADAIDTDATIGDAPTDTDDAASDAVVIDALEIACGGSTCDPNAECVGDPKHCECKPGFAGDGLTCSDVDECATNNGGCAAACANTPGSHVCFVPASCDEIRASTPSFTGATTLYVQRDIARPWSAYCDGAREYLPLASADNYSQYTRDDQGTSVRTAFTRLAIDPATLVVDIADQTFSSSTGSLQHNGITVTSMPYAVAMDCRGNNSNSGIARIDLTNTPFVVDDTFQERGNFPDSTVTITDGGRRVALTGGGNCGWIAPSPAPFNPFNQLPPTPILELSYSP